MAENRRKKRYADSLKRTLGTIIETKLSDPRKGFVTLTKVKMSPDLKVASVYYTVLGDEAQKKMTAKFFEKSNAYIKVELRPYITSRWVPELRFFYDETLEQVQRIEQLLEKIKDDTTPAEK